MRRASALVVVAFIGAASAVAAEVEVQQQTFSLSQLATRDAATLLRTILEVKTLEVVDDRTVRATAPADHLRIAAELLAAVDMEEGALQAHTISDGDEIVIAVTPLGRIPPSDAMSALRRLQIRKLAVGVTPGYVVIRDTEAQVEAALELLDSLRPPEPE